MIPNSYKIKGIISIASMVNIHPWYNARYKLYFADSLKQEGHEIVSFDVVLPCQFFSEMTCLLY
jgi:hypothetical protein